ncbi:hypothetical protein FRC12_011162 [Ceratobasidium sp. 428]|nr:hypothetical protein FRC12_011162 [Ceratobasidium sp. 428]
MTNNKPAASSPRNIVILFDGTGKDGNRDSQTHAPVTNVWRLYKIIDESKTEVDEVIYFPGVGTDEKKLGASNMLAQMFGHTAVYLIKRVYMILANLYQPGDIISLFGYSRGAFIVRKVASLIGVLGLIRDENDFDKYWRGLEHKLPGSRRRVNPPPNPTPVPVSCLGVWDTIGAVRPTGFRETLNLLTLPDNDLPKIVQLALHVIAYHENRKLFNVILFDNQNDRDECNQTCFPGAHADVGGGSRVKSGSENVLPDLSLGWILTHLPSTIRHAKQTLVSQVPIPFRLSDAYHDSPLWKRIPDKLVPRRHLKDLLDLKLHPTLSEVSAPQSRFLLDWGVDDNEIRGLSNSLYSSRVFGRIAGALPPQVGVRFPVLALSPTTAAVGSPSLFAHITRQDSTSTQRTDSTGFTRQTLSTPRTSIMSTDSPPQPNPDILPTINDDCNGGGSPPGLFDSPASISTPPTEARRLQQSLFDQGAHAVEKTDTGAEKSTPTTQSRASAVRVKSKRTIMKKVKSFFRKAFCCGSSNLMET